MKASDKLRQLAWSIQDPKTAVKLDKSFELEEAMNTAAKMMKELISCPEGRQEIIPGVSVEFTNDMPLPNLYPPTTVHLFYKNEKWRKEKDGEWEQY